MKILNNSEEQIHIIDNHSTVWDVIKKITSTGVQEEAFYICNIKDIVRKHKIWKSLLPRIQPFYAVKCNDSLVILKILNALGTGFDCASKSEINKILNLGVDTNRIIFANPAKPASHIRHAAFNNVLTMTFDNDSELYKIKELHPNSRLVIRIRCDAKDALCNLGIKFGCDPIDEAPQLLQLALSLNLNVVGVSFHVGSGCREAAVYERAIKTARNIFDYGKLLGFQFNLLDIGGGYPGNSQNEFVKIAEYINLAIDEYFNDKNIKIIAEPGRFYVSSAYTLACNIHSIRNTLQKDPLNDTIIQHKMYYINDGVYGSFNCILYDHQIINAQVLYDKPAGTKYYSSSIWGPTCDGLDQISNNILLPELNLGDWLIFENMGAYTIPVACTFNGFPIPKVHIAVNEKFWNIFKNHLIINDNNNQITNIKNDINIDENLQLPSLPIKIPIYYNNNNNNNNDNNKNNNNDHTLDYADNN